MIELKGLCPHDELSKCPDCGSRIKKMGVWCPHTDAPVYQSVEFLCGLHVRRLKSLDEESRAWTWSEWNAAEECGR